ncbi:Uncharacterised protein [Bordetella pertussis]|nr:Uncharacterised protein [Bordetella pertussis]
MADIEAFDAQSIERLLVGIEIQRLGQRQGAPGARARFGQCPRQRHLGVFLRLLQP